jgi:hypothetical protein
MFYVFRLGESNPQACWRRGPVSIRNVKREGENAIYGNEAIPFQKMDGGKVRSVNASSKMLNSMISACFQHRHEQDFF